MKDKNSVRKTERQTKKNNQIKEKYIKKFIALGFEHTPVVAPYSIHWDIRNLEFNKTLFTVQQPIYPLPGSPPQKFIGKSLST